MPSVKVLKKGLKEFSEKSAVLANSLGGGRLRIYASMIYCLIRYGARPIDYERFRFWEKSAYQRNRYMTIYRYFKVIKWMDPITFKEISGRKEHELETFSSFIHRKWIKIDKNTPSQTILDFCKTHPKVIAKPEHGEQGRGVRLIENCNQEVVSSVIDDLNNDSFILEECVENAEYIKELNPTSLNTVRVTTIVNHDKRPTILSVVLRVGAPGSVIDNWGGGGVGYNFDVDTGICIQPGIDKKNRTYIFHPGSGKQMVGFKLQKFEELKNYALKLALAMPKAQYVGWDIAITPNGFELIEMNCPAGHDMFQSFGTPFYDVIRKNLKS